MCFSFFQTFHLSAFVNRARFKIRKQQKIRMQVVHRLVTPAFVAGAETYRHIWVLRFSVI